MMTELTNFSDFKQYGQLLSRMTGLAATQGYGLFMCIYDGAQFIGGKDFYDVGLCSGQLGSQLFDITL